MGFVRSGASAFGELSPDPDERELIRRRSRGSPEPRKKSSEAPRCFVGVDLGQQSDYTAICVASEVGDELHVVHLERFRNVLYPEVADRVGRLMDSPELAGEAELVIDATGVGPAVTDIFTRQGRRFTAVKIHGGDAVSNPAPGEYRVPKRDLVSGLQVLLQSGKLKISAGLEHAATLREELLNFRIKINIQSGHDSYEAHREGDHDDLVLAAALAAWRANYKVPEPRIRRIEF